MVNNIDYKKYIGKVVRHFKGNYYYIENIGRNSETNEEMVIYRPLYDNKDNIIWIRPFKMFFESIDNKDDNITGQKHRFEIVEQLSVNYQKKSI